MCSLLVFVFDLNANFFWFCSEDVLRRLKKLGDAHNKSLHADKVIIILINYSAIFCSCTSTVYEFVVSIFTCG